MYKLRDYQQEAVDAGLDYLGGKSRTGALLVEPTGCHAKGTAFVLADGQVKLVEDIKVGDKLIGDDGTNRTVIGIHRGEEELFKIIPIKGEPFIVNKNHILSLCQNAITNTNPIRGVIDFVTVEDYIKKNKTYKHLHKLYRTPFVNFEPIQEPEIDPYFLGVYIGDGSSANECVSITTQREEIVSYMYDMVKDMDIEIRVQEKSNSSNKSKSYSLHSGIQRGRKGRNCIINILRSLNLFKHTAADKFIPQHFLCASRENRLKLLAGLLDTDSHYDNLKKSFEYCTKSIVLAKQIEFLCRSLGFYAKIGKTKIVKEEKYYRIIITGELDIIPTKVKIRKGENRNQIKSIFVTGFKVEYAGYGEYYGFEVDGNHLYCDGQLFVHHNSGKSLIIGGIAKGIGKPLLVIQPNRELTLQNYERSASLGLSPTIFSASCNSKNLSPLTYATLKSVKKVIDELKSYGIKHVIVDEADMGIPMVSADNPSEWQIFQEAMGFKKVLGLTASPVKMQHYSPMTGEPYSQLNMLNRIQGKTFSKILHVLQNKDIIQKGFWAPLKYEKWSFDSSSLIVNSVGSEFTDDSIKKYVTDHKINNLIASRVIRLAEDHKSILVFMDSVDSCKVLCDYLNEKRGINSVVVDAKMPIKARKNAVDGFKSGRIKVALCYATLGVGFDYPALECIIYGRPTFSARTYYQAVGRLVRKDPENPGKIGLVVDCCGNYDRFGPIEDLSIEEFGGYGWGMFSGDRLLTGVPMGSYMNKKMLIEKYGMEPSWKKEQQNKDTMLLYASSGDYVLPDGQYKGKMLKDVPWDYLEFVYEYTPKDKINGNIVKYMMCRKTK